MLPDDPTQDPDINPNAAPAPAEPVPDAVTARLDPGGLKDALGRTGRMLKTAGLPFEDEEFDGDDEHAAAGTPDAGADTSDDDDSSTSSDSSDA